jgi:exodeoxyribonuclease V alpha subunit
MPVWQMPEEISSLALDLTWRVLTRRDDMKSAVDGIGPARRKKIKAAWVEQKAVPDIMIFLHSHGVSTSRAVRIYKAYGDRAIETV